jgi:hypothetical protein
MAATIATNPDIAPRMEPTSLPIPRGGSLLLLTVPELLGVELLDVLVVVAVADDDGIELVG